EARVRPTGPGSARHGGPAGWPLVAGGRRPAERQRPGRLRHPRPRAGRAARDPHRTVPARRLRPSDQQHGALRGAGLPGPGRWADPLAAVLAGQHALLRPVRLGAHPSGNGDPGRQRRRLRLADLSAGPGGVVPTSGTGAAGPGRPAGVRRADLGRPAGGSRCQLAGPPRRGGGRRAGGPLAAPPSVLTAHPAPQSGLVAL
ncbi:MAG: hypothetical protein AVDCRST_MAG61-130, partial [uncultured Friedmanniella sp.]